MYCNILCSGFTYILDGYGDISRCCASFGLGTGPIHLNYIHCSGREQRLIDCRHENSTNGNHQEDWSVSCKNGELLSFVEVGVLSNVCLQVCSATTVLKHASCTNWLTATHTRQCPATHWPCLSTLANHGQ